MRYVAVVGPGRGARDADVAAAREAGAVIARRGWITLTGGRAEGVMAAAAEGARSAGGVSVGLLPDADRRDAAAALSVVVATGLGEARNVVLVNASDAVIACGISPGTLSEVALALKATKPVALLGYDSGAAEALLALGGQLVVAGAPEDAVLWIEARLDGESATATA